MSFWRKLADFITGHHDPFECRGKDCPPGRAVDDAEFAMALIGLGFRRISMSPAAVGPVKMMVRSLDTRTLSSFMEALYARPDATVRAELLRFAEENDIQL